MNANEFIEKVRGLVLNNVELNKTVTEFVREHPECWLSSAHDEKSKLVGLNIGINFHSDSEQIKKARPWFSIDLGYHTAEFNYAETLHEKRNDPGVYICYTNNINNKITLKGKVNW